MLQQLQQLAQSGRIDEALRLSYQACTADPSQPDLWLLRASFQAQKNDLTGVIESCQRVLSLQPENISARYNLAVALQTLQRDAEAIEQYQGLLDQNPQHVTCLNNLGALLIESGQALKASRLLESAVTIQPAYSIAHNTLGLAYDKLDRHRDAQQQYQIALQLDPELLSARSNVLRSLHLDGHSQQSLSELETFVSQHPDYTEGLLLKAHILNDTGKCAEALHYAETLASQNPSNPDILFYLADLYTKRGAIDAAIGRYEAIIASNPHHVRALNNLGSLYQGAGNTTQALATLSRAAQQAPHLPEIQINLASLYWNSGDEKSAFKYCLSALQTAPKQRAFLQYFTEILGSSGNFQPSPTLAEIIVNCLKDSGIDQQSLAPPVLTLILSDLQTSKLFRRCEQGETPDWKEFLLLSRNKHARILALLMQNTVLSDPAAEYTFRAARRASLFTYVRADGSLSRCAKDDEQSLLSSLAHQCFNNEFAYIVSAQEEARLNALASSATDEKGRLVTRALLLSLYQSITSVDDGAILAEALQQSEHPALSALAEKHFGNPAQEHALRDKIETLTAITDATSNAVREQYEESPYPRWLSVNLHSSKPFPRAFREIFPHFTPPDFAAGELQTLVAGCGTGKHAILSATRFQNNKVTAVDLSRSSLAYGIRKTRELGINNIDFFCGDILNLHRLEKRFDIIESVGVLHHLQDPAAGLRSLRSLLRPNGLMNLGFYSKLARRAVYAARNHYQADTGLPDLDGIRHARAEILTMPDGHPVHPVVNFRDFYSLSECRDLLFHTQEHSYRLEEIKDMLALNGLKFIGFEFPTPRIKLDYKREYPEDLSCTDFSLWDKFEQRHPDTFSGMYVFWCQAENE